MMDLDLNLIWLFNNEEEAGAGYQSDINIRRQMANPSHWMIGIGHRGDVMQCSIDFTVSGRLDSLNIIEDNDFNLPTGRC